MNSETSLSPDLPPCFLHFFFVTQPSTYFLLNHCCLPPAFLPPSSCLSSSFLLPPSSFFLPPSSFLLPPPSFLLPFLLSLLPPLTPLSPLSFPLVGRDIECEPCQRFFREGLTTSFMRILTDDAVSTWKPDIQVSGYSDLCTCSVSSFSILAQLHCQLTQQQLHVLKEQAKSATISIFTRRALMCQNFLLPACVLASFPGSPGTQICFAGRAWYLFYVSKIGLKQKGNALRVFNHLWVQRSVCMIFIPSS